MGSELFTLNPITPVWAWLPHHLPHSKLVMLRSNLTPSKLADRRFHRGEPVDAITRHY